ncbi:Limonene 1,2-monooxygenase [Bhargavaea cecembensis DSE10]|uniref:Limonene 1,2-monooxygenase n=1 Tax=Bhargavaea cecembensis DSE10 TaxID=1235279 RepID=M7N8K0_9BACL|nr:LLM class flavin-dependent oxidoreductase [Bhargavaea cecembensis]EMR04928.1 Limonene 1,2-monooxygenase [Bhargavaea cecembensis DSE10]
MTLKLGILDQSPVFPESSAEQALKQTVSLARKAEEWGYSRFWVSEHHHSQDVAGSSPEVLISYLAAKTESIRIGSGGVMLQHYSPYKVAENFNLLSSLAPGRVDLGVGKAPGGLPLSTKALQFGTVNDGKDFDERLSLLKQLVEDSVPEGHPLDGIQATPLPTEKPEIFLLGASPNSAKLAASLGVGFVFALFINNNREILGEAANEYRRLLPGGNIMVAAHVLAAPTQEEAEKLAADQKIVKVRLQDGRSVTVVTVEQAHSFGEQAGIPYEIEEQQANIIAGTPDYVTGILSELQQAHQIDEFILHTALPKAEDRTRSFQLLSPQSTNARFEVEEQENNVQSV